MQSGENFCERRFYTSVVFICSLYALLAGLYIARTPLVMDEFQGAYLVSRLEHELPYRDFRPYKNVLGYYLQAIPLKWSHSTWQGLMSIKFATLGVNIVAILSAAHLLAKRFRRTAVCFGTLMFVVMTTFLERSAVLRVDMLTAWFGLFSLLFLLDRRFLVAGLLAGLSFLVSQKGIYYSGATAVALGGHWALAQRDRQAFAQGVTFATASIAVFLAYLAFWTWHSSLEQVIAHMFLSHGKIAFGNLYNIRHFWWQTLSRNPVFYGLAAAGVWTLLRREPEESTQEPANSASDPPGSFDQRRLLATYGLVLLACCVWHKQPWPYFFVLLIPTCYVMIVVFLDSEWRVPRWPPLAIKLAIGMATLLPLIRVPHVLQRSNATQHQNIAWAESLLGENDNYFAGMRLLLRHPHALHELAWLDEPRRRELREQSEDEQLHLVAKFDAACPKVVIWNYRLDELDGALRTFLEEHYRPWRGNVWVYQEPLAGRTTVDIRFAGGYRLVGPPTAIARIDGKDYIATDTIPLEPGEHTVSSELGTHLVYAPAAGESPLPKPDSLFTNPYSY